MSLKGALVEEEESKQVNLFLCLGEKDKVLY